MISPESSEAGRLALKICEHLRRAGHQALLVGGCVRDMLLDRPPLDYDVATDARPGEVLALFPGSLPVGAQFGVVLVREGNAEVEVATFRADLGYRDGRHPEAVMYTDDPSLDAQRRDFTINGMFWDPFAQKILDFVGGQQDMQAGVIRAIGNPEERFREDHLRLLRAVRFAARFGFVIEPATYEAIVRLAPLARDVSAERLRDELTKILTEGQARRGFELLDQTGLLDVVLPEVARMRGVPQPPEYHPEGDVWTHTLLMLERLPAGCSPTLAWGVLLHDVGKPLTYQPPAGPGGRIRFDGHTERGAELARNICRRLRFSNAATDQIAELVAQHLRFKDAPRMRLATLKRFVRQPNFAEHLELHRLDCLASHGNLSNYQFVKNFLETTPAEEVRPPRLVTGDDLIAMGLEPGPVFRQILQAVEEAQLEGRVRQREEALELVRQIVAQNSRASKQG
jgi:poly(A) polymerase